MTPRIVEILYQMIAFLFAISVHESAHAWTASRCGDPTARMLGRVSLNPIRHIDPIGTIVLPLVAAISRHTVAWLGEAHTGRSPEFSPSCDGRHSDFCGRPGQQLHRRHRGASASWRHLAFIGLRTHSRYGIVGGDNGASSDSALAPIAVLLYELMFINIVLAVFNLIPVPPLDGSHVLRHFLSEPVRMVYDRIGIFALLALVYLGGGLLSSLLRPFVHFYLSMLVQILNDNSFN